MQQDYNNTINLPKTEFPMRAGLPKREPGFLENWEKNDLYHELMKKNEGKPLFVLHDGPPYANGNLHMGHAFAQYDGLSGSVHSGLGYPWSSD